MQQRVIEAAKSFVHIKIRNNFNLVKSVKLVEQTKLSFYPLHVRLSLGLLILAIILASIMSHLMKEPPLKSVQYSISKSELEDFSKKALKAVYTNKDIDAYYDSFSNNANIRSISAKRINHSDKMIEINFPLGQIKGGLNTSTVKVPKSANLMVLTLPFNAVYWNSKTQTSYEEKYEALMFYKTNEQLRFTELMILPVLDKNMTYNEI